MQYSLQWAQRTLLFIVITLSRTEEVILHNIFQVLSSTLRRLIWSSSKRRLSRHFKFFLIFKFIFWVIELLSHLQNLCCRNIKSQSIFNMLSTDKMLRKDVWFYVLGKRLVLTPQITFQNVGKIILLCTTWSVRKVLEGFIFTQSK